MLRTADLSDLDAITALLTGSALPVDDLRTSSIGFVVAEDAGAVVGVVGLEAFGDAGLLRSLAVAPSRRGLGLGGELVEALERDACGRGLRQLVLLTQTAERFFAQRGYRVIARGDAPPAIQGSAEFRSICPASAVCMAKTLG